MLSLRGNNIGVLRGEGKGRCSVIWWDKRRANFSFFREKSKKRFYCRSDLLSLTNNIVCVFKCFSNTKQLQKKKPKLLFIRPRLSTFFTKKREKKWNEKKKKMKKSLLMKKKEKCWKGKNRIHLNRFRRRPVPPRHRPVRSRLVSQHEYKYSSSIPRKTKTWRMEEGKDTHHPFAWLDPAPSHEEQNIVSL